ncbi:hypothetical protein LXA43DRAFT_871197, partial [Ganoderma leucocontextum]
SHPEYGRKCFKLLRVKNRHIPVPIGPHLPRRDRGNELQRYCRLMLILFKLWCSVVTLRPDNTVSWQTTYDQQFPHLQSTVVDIMDNMAILHECRDSRNDHMRQREQARK